MLNRKKFAKIVIYALLLSSLLLIGNGTLAQTNDIRSLDGTGNNLQNPDWGSANEPYIRYSDAAYGDGVSSPAGEYRPSARTISNTFSSSPEDGLLSDRNLAAFVYAWGQFIDHDITLTNSADPREMFLIVVPSGDVWFDPEGAGTAIIPVSRSIYDPTTGTSTDNPRQQMNSISAFIDGSMVYGSDSERANALRTFNHGLLKTTAGNLLPFNDSGFDNANDARLVPDNELFLAGDVRANENPELLSLQTLFVREHNRIAAIVAQENPNWTDEELYQYARSIVIAEMQKITYDEFLPALLGSNAIPTYRGYQEDVNPTITIEFSTAAYRFGHSMLGDNVGFLDNNGNEIRDPIELHESFFYPPIISQTGIDPVLKNLATDIAQEIDTITVDALRNFLFGEPGQGGFDLAALNIQRGRDHGLADYNSVRAAYGLNPVTNFSQITSDPSMQAKLAATYGNVDNIDLWIGGLAEDHLPNSSLGITFTRILVDQFTRIRDGDRFWYQNTLSNDDLRFVERTSLADIIENNTALTSLQENVFFFIEGETEAEVANAEVEENDTDGRPPENNEANGPPPNEPRCPPNGGRGQDPNCDRNDRRPGDREGRPPRG